jgi:hypothetical protein
MDCLCSRLSRFMNLCSLPDGGIAANRLNRSGRGHSNYGLSRFYWSRMCGTVEPAARVCDIHRTSRPGHSKGAWFET